MTVPDLLSRGRSMHRLLLTDTCTITRPGPKAFDPATGGYTTTPTVVYEGSCRVRSAPASTVPAQERVAAVSEQVLLRPVLQLPHGATGPQPGDTATVAGDAPGDYRLIASAGSTTATAASWLVERLEVDH